MAPANAICRAPLKFGIVYPNSDEYVDADLALRTALLAEEHGFDCFLTWDHYMLPESNKMFEAWSLLSFIASKTSKIRLGTCVSPIPLRPPALFAKTIANLDYLSDGRVILGVGAGWHRPEFEGYSVWDGDATRVAKTREALELMIGLWTKPSVTFRGKFYQASGAALEPKPKQRPYPEMWFGTTGARMLELSARVGSGWIPNMLSPGEYEKGTKTLRRLLSAERKKTFHFTYNLYDPFRETKDYLRSIEEFEQAGCDTYMINWKYGRKQCLDRIEWFAKEVKASFV